jgi:hypothetical protein
MSAMKRLWQPVRSAVAVALAVGLALSLGVGAPAAARKSRTAPIGAEFFGTHHHGLHLDDARGWPQAPVGSVRLWDNGVAWNEIETAPGVFDWTRLDGLVGKARANGASVLLVLGQTPTFHSTRPTVLGAYGPGASSMPTKAAWTAYVRAVAQRNRDVWGGAVQLQVWNEANALPYWAGTPQQMAQLTAWTREALRSVGSSTRLVAPAMVTRLTGQRAWIKAFYSQKVARKNVSAYVDALSFQLYPLATGSPEASMALLAGVRKILAKLKVDKPIYNTEINYGLVGGPEAGAAARVIAPHRQAGYLARTYLLNAQNRVSRVYWYRWDSHGMVNTELVTSDDSTLTEAGRSFAVVRSWLLGTRPAGCVRDRKGTFSCAFTAGKAVRRAVWNPSRSIRVVVPKKVTSYVTLDGVAHATRPGRKVTAGELPILLRTR